MTWFEARLMRNTVVLREVAAGAELERLEAFIVQAPTNTGLSEVHLDNMMFPLDVGPSRLIAAISANDRHGFFTHPKQRRSEAFSYKQGG